MDVHSAELHLAWPLLLQQQPDLLQQQRSACTLLGVSKGMAACLHAVAAGQLQCKTLWSSDSDSDTSLADKEAVDSRACARLLSLRQWLARNGQLLQSLDLAVPGEALQAAGVPAALRQAAAAAAPPGLAMPHNPAAGTAAERGSSSSSSTSALQLQSFRGPLVAPLLQQLPGHSLTSLVIADEVAEATDDWELAALVRRSMRHLTRLQRLVLIEDQETNVNLLVPALAHMQQLTYLDIGIHRGRPQDLHHLPASLLELNIGATTNSFEDITEDGERPSGNLDLGHLTALTKLSLVREVPEELLPIDVLPPGLVELECCSVPSPEPLLHLQHLRQLSMRGGMPAEGLQRLATALTALQSVELSYWSHSRFNSSEAAAAAEGWGDLPV
jgi:hypothetical protein